MVWYILFGTLAAFGALCAVWTALGWVLPRGKACVLVCAGEPDMGTVCRWKWLRAMGWLDCPLIVAADEELPYLDGDIERCSPGDLLFRLEMERNRFDGTGNGDPSGRHQRCGISEL